MSGGFDWFEDMRARAAAQRQRDEAFAARVALLRGDPGEQRDDRRRAAIEALIEQGATPGERAAAQAAMQRVTEADAIGEFLAAQFEQDDPFEED